MRIYKSLLAASVSVFVSFSIAPAVEAGTPWSCVCDGKKKRFIGATNACEIQLYQRVHKTLDGYKSRGPRCTYDQWRDWNTRACKQEHCKPPEFLK
jgi:hypothetical protein